MRNALKLLVVTLTAMTLGCNGDDEGGTDTGSGDGGSGGSQKDAEAQLKDAETQPRDAENPLVDSGNRTADAEEAIDDDASVEVECVRGSVFEGDRLYGPYEIRNMSDLERLAGYERMAGDLFIPFDPREETEIDSLSYLRCLTTASACRIGPTKALKRLDGLNNLTDIAWDMNIAGNGNLENVDGLINLRTVGKAAERAADDPATGLLAISQNDSLLNLKGLANLNYLYGYLIITNNRSLPTCEAIALKEQLEKAGWNREATICGNLADECGSDPCPD